jgi:hypothetical protein
VEAKRTPGASPPDLDSADARTVFEITVIDRAAIEIAISVVRAFMAPTCNCPVKGPLGWRQGNDKNAIAVSRTNQKRCR